LPTFVLFFFLYFF